MRIPMAPPKWGELFTTLLRTPEGMARFQAMAALNIGPAPEGKYRHWDILRQLTPPGDLTHEEWWLGLKLARQHLYHTLPLRDKKGDPFKYAFFDAISRMVHEIDKNASGAIRGSEQVTNPQTRDRYLFKSLVEESITSSQLEGAATTREAAKDMIRSGRTPRDRGEQMIFNNFAAMQQIRQLENKPLTPSIVLELQRTLTDGTLADPDAAGRLRRADEPIVIEDETGRLLHQPPPANELQARLEAMCKFANSTDTQPFVHPVLRAILLHFWLAYDHPFVDGNGRTARALFYWSMATQGYWLCEFISISRILKRAPSRYYRSFLYTETDDNDATYFVLNQLRVIIEAIEELHEYLARKTREDSATGLLLRNSRIIKASFNHRQLAVVQHALKHPSYIYTFDSHRMSHNVTYETARTDLLELAEQQLLEKRKAGKRFIFVSPEDLKSRIEQFAKDGSDSEPKPGAA